MPKYARFDHTVEQPAPVIGWYDTDFVVYNNMPDAADLVEVDEADWPDRFLTPFVKEGKLVVGPPPSIETALAAAKLEKTRLLSIACEQAITSGYVSDALGANYTYPSDRDNQLNMSASVIASLIPSAIADTSWVTPFLCANAAGLWEMRNHSAAQIQKVGEDGKMYIQALRIKYAHLAAEVSAAETVDAVNVVVW